LPTYLKNTKQHQFIITHLNFCSVSCLQGHQCGLNWCFPAPWTEQRDRAQHQSPTPFMSNIPDVERLLVARGTNARVENWSRILNLGANWFWSKDLRCFVPMQQYIRPQATHCRPISACFWLAQPIQPYRFIFAFVSSSLKRHRVVHLMCAMAGYIANCRTAAPCRSSREEGAEGLLMWD
jgi:hypothetical protein